MDTTKLFQNAYNYAKQNPDTEFATQLRKRIENGEYNKEVAALGLHPQTPAISAQQPQTYSQEVNQDAQQTKQGITNAVDQRVTNFDQISADRKAGKTSLVGATLQKLGEGAALANDVVGEVAKGAVKSILPQKNENALKENIGTLVKPVEPLAQYISKQQEKLKKTNPKLAKNLEATFHLAELGLNVAGVGVGEEAAVTGAKKLVNVTADAGNAAGTALGEAAQGSASKIGGALKNTGEMAYGVGVGTEEPTKMALQSYEATQPNLFGRVRNLVAGENPTIKSDLTKPITETNTAVRKGLVGTEWHLGVQAKQVANDLWKGTIAPALESSGEKINMKNYLGEIKSDIMKVSDLNRRNTLLDAYNKFAEDYKKVGNFSLPKLQEYKEGWAKFIPEATYKGKPIGGSLNEIRNIAAQKARKIIYDKLGGDIKTAYIDYGNLKSIEKAGLKSVDLLRSKGFTKQAWEAVLDKVVTPITTIGGQILYKAGEGLELIGNKGAKTVGDIIESPQKVDAISTKTTSTTNTIKKGINEVSNTSKSKSSKLSPSKNKKKILGAKALQGSIKRNQSYEQR